MGTVEPIRNKTDLEKIENLFKSESYRNFVLFCTGINTGLRISDILNLNVGDVKNKKYIKPIEQKTSKHKLLPINSKLTKIYSIYTKNKDIEEPLFITKFKYRMDRINAYNIIRKTCQKILPELNVGTHTLWLSSLQKV